MVFKKVVILIILFIASSCVVDKGSIKVSGLSGKGIFGAKTQMDNVSLSSVAIINNQLILNGRGLIGAKTLTIKGESFEESFSIESISDSQIIANGLRAFSFKAQKVFDLIISDAHGAASFPITLDLQDGSVTAAKLHHMNANDGDVLIFNDALQKWEPRPLSGLSYKGTWDAATDLEPSATPVAGDYWVASNAGVTTFGSALAFSSGDWIIYNGTDWQKITNTSDVISFNGRQGVILPIEGDYSLDQLADVDTTTTPPSAGQVLKWDGAKWAPSSDSTGVAAGSVTSGDITDNSITDADINSAANISQSKIQNLASDLAAKLNLSGGTMSGALDMGGNNIGNVGTVDGVDVSALSTSVTTNAGNISTNAGDILALQGNASSLATDITNLQNKNAEAMNTACSDGEILEASSGTFVCATPPSAGSSYWTQSGSDIYYNSGNVAIGAATSGVKLGIGGSLFNSAGNKLHVVNVGGFSPITFGEDSNNYGEMHWSDIGNFINFMTKSAGVTYNNTLVLRDGLVGIGKNNPSEKLDVLGKVKATELCIGADCRASWPTGGGSGTVTSVATGTGLTGGPITTTGTIAVDIGTTAGKIPQLDGAGRLPTSVETDPSVSAFAKTTLPTCGVGEVLKSDGTILSCVTDIDTDTDTNTTYTAGAGLDLTGTTFSVSAQGILDTNLSGLSSSCGNGQILLTNGLGSFSCGDLQWGENGSDLYFGNSVVIGGTTPDASALLDLQSTTKGFLPPRMTSAQRDAISSAASGLVIYNTTTNQLEVYNGAMWVGESSSNSSFTEVTNLSLQALPSNTWTKLAFDGIDSDSNDFFDEANNRFMPTMAGYYYISLETTLQASASASSYTYLGIYKNGTLVRDVINSAATSIDVEDTVSDLIYLNGTTDYIEGWFKSYSGARNILAGKMKFKATLMSGGSSGAGGLIADSVDSSHIQNNAVTTTEIADGTIASSDIAADTITVDNVDFASSNGINIPQLASDPVSGVAGQTYFNTTTKTLMVHDGTSWVSASSGSGGTSSSNFFESTWTTVAGATKYTFAHGLSDTPLVVQVLAKNTATGIITMISPQYAYGYSTYGGLGTVSADSTNIYVRTAADRLGAFSDSGAGGSLDFTNSTIRVVAWTKNAFGGGGGSGSSGGSASTWVAVSLADTSSFDIECEYKFVAGAIEYRANVIDPNRIQHIFNTMNSNTTSSYLSISSSNKASAAYHQDNWSNNQISAAKTVTSIEKRCGAVTISEVDNLGNHTATQDLNLGANKLVGNSGTEGIEISATGDVGIGVSSPTEKLDVAGKVKGTELCIGADCRSSWPVTSSGGTVTSVATGVGLTGGTITATGTIAVDVGTTSGKIPQLDGTGKLATSVETDPSVSAFAKSALPTCGAGQVLKSNGTSFSCVADIDTDTNTTYSAGSGLALTGTTFSANLAAANIPALDASKITTGTMATARLPASTSYLGSTIESAEITDGTVAAADLASSSVTTAKIATGAVTSAKLGLIVRECTSFGTATCSNLGGVYLAMCPSGYYAMSGGGACNINSYMQVNGPTDHTSVTNGAGWATGCRAVSGNTISIPDWIRVICAKF